MAVDESRGGGGRVTLEGLRRRLSGSSILLWPAIGYLVVFYLVPVADMLRLSVSEPAWGLGNFRELLNVAYYGRVVVTTFEISFSVASLSILLGLPIALFVVQSKPLWRNLSMVCVVVPFFTSLLVRNYAWIFLLGQKGVINEILLELEWIDAPVQLMFNRFGVMVGMTHIMLPFAVLIMVATLSAIRKDLQNAAASLGCGPFGVFRRVILPLSLPGIGAAFTITFVLSIAFFVTPAMLGSPRDLMIANIIASEVGFLNWGMGAALSVVLLVITLASVAAAQRVFGGFAALAPGLSQGKIGHRHRIGLIGNALCRVDPLLNPVWRPFVRTFGILGIAFLIVPVSVLIPLSFSTAEFFVFPPPDYSLKWYQAYLGDARWLRATGNSFKVAGLVVVFTMSIAVPAALAMARSKARFVEAIYLLLISPMIVPAIIVAISLLLLFTKLGLSGSILGVALGHTVGALPLAVIIMLTALSAFDWTLERAAMSLGANRFRSTVKVVLPVISGSVLTASFLAFLYSFDELLVSLFVSGIRAETLPKKMWESLQEINPTIAAVSSLLIVLTVMVLLLSFAFRAGLDRTRGRNVNMS